MIPLAACSIVALAVILERLWAWRGLGRSAESETVLARAAGGQLEEAGQLGERSTNPVARVLAAGIRYRNPAATLAMEAATRTEAAAQVLTMTIRTLAVATMALGLGALTTIAVPAQTLTDDPAFALYRQATQAAEAKDYAKASDLAKQAIAAYPDHLLAWYLLGQAAMGRGAWEEAADAFENVVKRYPDSFAGYRDLGLALDRLNRTDDARAAFETALAKRPDNQDVRVRLALMLYDKGQRDAALPHLEALAQANTPAPEVYLMLARAYYDKNDLLASEKAFSRAAALRDDGRTWFNLAIVRLRLNDTAGAQEAFQRAATHADVREQAMRELDKLRSGALKPATK